MKSDKVFSEITQNTLDRLNKALGDTPETNKTAAERLNEQYKAAFNPQPGAKNPDKNTILDGIASAVYMYSLKNNANSQFNEQQYKKSVAELKKDKNFTAMIKRVGMNRLYDDIKEGDFITAAIEYKKQTVLKKNGPAV